MGRDSRKGHRREYDVIDSFCAAGFHWTKAQRSGQSVHDERRKWRIPGDLFLWHPHVGGFQAEVGGSKNISAEFAELRGCLIAGFRPLLVLWRKSGKIRKRWYYITEGDRFATVPELLEAARGL
jgi:hypothetical protein